MKTISNLEDLSTENIKATLVAYVNHFPSPSKVTNFIHCFYQNNQLGLHKENLEYKCLFKLGSFGTNDYLESMVCRVEFDSKNRIIPKGYEIELLNNKYFKNELKRAYDSVLLFLELYLEKTISKPNLCQQTLSNLTDILKNDKCEINNSGIVDSLLNIETFKAMVLDMRAALKKKISDSILLLRYDNTDFNSELNGLIKKELIKPFLKFEEEELKGNNIISSNNNWMGSKADFGKLILALDEFEYYHSNIKFNRIKLLKSTLVKRYNCTFSATDDMLKPNKLKAYSNKLGVFDRLSILKATYKGL